MPPASRKGDQVSGHEAFPPTTIENGSDNVLTNGIPTARLGDSIVIHCDPDSCHSSTIGGGSGSVLVNGQGLARIADPIKCGSVITKGSGNVIVGG